MFAFRRLRESPTLLAALFAAGTFVLALQASATEAARKSFASAEEAAGALVEAAKADNDKELLAILGPSLKEWIESGDPVADKQAKERFISDYEQKHSIETNEPNTATLVIGDDDFPFPILLVKSDN